MKFLTSLVIVFSFLLSLYCSVSVLWTGRAHVARFSDRVAIRSEDPVGYWIPTALILTVTIVSGFAVSLVVLPEKQSKRFDLNSISLRKRK